MADIDMPLAWRMQQDGYLMQINRLRDERDKLRMLVQDMHKAYIGILNECSGMAAGLIWEYSDDVDTELAKMHTRFNADYHRFDVDMNELGIEVGE